MLMFICANSAHSAHSANSARSAQSARSANHPPPPSCFNASMMITKNHHRSDAASARRRVDPSASASGPNPFIHESTNPIIRAPQLRTPRLLSSVLGEKFPQIVRTSSLVLGIWCFAGRLSLRSPDASGLELRLRYCPRSRRQMGHQCLYPHDPRPSPLSRPGLTPNVTVAWTSPKKAKIFQMHKLKTPLQKIQVAAAPHPFYPFVR